MSFLQERPARRYFALLCGLAAVLLALALLLAGLQARMAQALLFQSEERLAGALLAQGIPAETVAAALNSTAGTPAGAALLAQLGHTPAAAPRLFPALRPAVQQFALLALGLLALPAAGLVLVSARFLGQRDHLYRRAARAVAQYAEGSQAARLPTQEEGALFQLFAAVEELALALQAKNETAQQAKTFLKNTISDISHQLKTPLAALQLYAEIILNEPENPEAVTGFAQRSLQSLARMEQLIQALLKVTRLDAGSIRFQPQPLPLGKLAARATQDLTARARAEGKQLVLQGDPNETLTCDPDWTAEALGNLVKNGLDHTRRGGTVRIGWQRSPGLLRLTVSDDGSGIAPEDLHHIFKRFYRSQTASSRQGVGLGLPLAKAIVEGQGGSLSVQSAPGQGAAFTISFLTGS